ncbi:hypothetical protein FACS1894122_09020 [Alphaproteobacteria bacterium]|nr:hypothetical protein FACS1894122_09020 [Alphaproteobacteria bacterium]
MSSTLKLSPLALEKIRERSRLQKMMEEEQLLKKKEAMLKSAKEKAEKRNIEKQKLYKQKLEKKQRYQEFVQKRDKVLQWLFEQYPLCFRKIDPLPLKVGIINDILATIPEDSELSKSSFRKTIAGYTHTKAYLQSLISNQYRYDLAGNQTEEVSEDNKQSAQLKLDEKAKRKNK